MDGRLRGADEVTLSMEIMSGEASFQETKWVFCLVMTTA
jgi:hypothetical protein